MLTFLDLNDDAIEHVFSFLDPCSLARVAQVSKLFDRTSSQDLIWITKCSEAGRLADDPEPKSGSWKQHYVMNYHRRHFSRDRCHPDIQIINHGRTASVPSSSTNTNYKGVMVDRVFPKRGVGYVEVTVKFLDQGDSSDHISIGIGNASFNTKTNCGEGWIASNQGAGWYSSNGAVYTAGSARKVCNESAQFNETIHDGDKIGVLLDRDKGKLEFYRNDVLQNISVIGDQYKAGEALFPCFILMHDVEVTLQQIPPAEMRRKGKRDCSVM
jgi:hypothetical protein